MSALEEAFAILCTSSRLAKICERNCTTEKNDVGTIPTDDEEDDPDLDQGKIRVLVSLGFQSFVILGK